VVGSLDSGCSHYGVKVFQQDPFQEIMTTLESAVTELLLDFQERNKNSELPQVLIYNDLHYCF
jgi:hypothetical protein